MPDKIITSRVLFLFSVFTLLFVVSCNRGQNHDIPHFSDHYRRFVETLSSDVFEGRAPTTPGGRKTKAFIEAEFRRMGLKPANNGSFRQAVPLIEITGSSFTDLLVLDSIGRTISLLYGTDMIVGSTLQQDTVSLDFSELVFAGYGIVAPEYNWDDYAGLDVKGKTVLVLVNDPGFELNDPALFTGRAMTYYGRWTYKFEEAARQGAAGVLIVHETEPASYGWDVVKNSWTGPQYYVGGKNNEPKVTVQGWIQKDAADSLFALAGYTLNELRQKALTSGFSAISLGMEVSVSFRNKWKYAQSYNIAGYVEGSVYPDEFVIYMAHWDHLGKVETAEGVEIYHGAIDNATGTAAIMAIAEKFAAMDPPPARSVLFIALTAEESGLIGSQYYALNPLFPLEKTAGGVNIDGMNVYGPTWDVSVVGFGASTLQNILQKHAEVQDRKLVPERFPEHGNFYRSDHFNLVKGGVPMIYANSGNEFIGRTERYRLMVEEDQKNRYHTPNDVINNLWDWQGIDQNLWLFFNVGLELANTDYWPQWSEGSEFRTIRETSDFLRGRKEEL